MAVFRSGAELLDEAGRVIGRGRAFVHLSRGEDEPQAATGTLSLTDWQRDAGAPSALSLPDRRQLRIQVEKDNLETCLAGGRILRYRTEWPPMKP